MIFKDREVKEFWILRESNFIAERKGKRELLGAQIIARNIKNNNRDLRAEISFEFFMRVEFTAGGKAGRRLLGVRILKDTRISAGLEYSAKWKRPYIAY